VTATELLSHSTSIRLRTDAAPQGASVVTGRE
jgi:hypothetical protein